MKSLSTWSPQNFFLGVYFDGKTWRVAGDLTPHIEEAHDDMESYRAEGHMTILQTITLDVPPKHGNTEEI